MKNIICIIVFFLSASVASAYDFKIVSHKLVTSDTGQQYAVSYGKEVVSMGRVIGIKYRVVVDIGIGKPRTYRGKIVDISYHPGSITAKEIKRMIQEDIVSSGLQATVDNERKKLTYEVKSRYQGIDGSVLTSQE